MTSADSGSRPHARRELIAGLPDAGRSAPVVREVEEMRDFDLYDVLAELGYGLEPKTRIARADAFDYKAVDWLQGFRPPPRGHAARPCSPVRTRGHG